MGKEALRLEWTIVEDERAWQTYSPAPVPSECMDTVATQAPADYAERRLATLVVLLGLFVAVVWVWQRQSAQAVFAGELQAAVAQDTDPQQAGLLAPTSGPVMPSGLSIQGAAQIASRLALPDVQIDGYALARDHVMARVTVAYPVAAGETSTYRETRFYRQTAGRWQRIEPDPALLGPWQTRQTAYFMIRHRAVDAAAIAEVAPRLDRLYARLRHDLGLPATVKSPNISIEVSGAEQANVVSYAKRTLVVPSPVLLSVPVEIPAADALYQAMVYPLATLVMSEVIDQSSPQWKRGTIWWRHLLDVIPLWVVAEEGGPLAVGQEDALRWLVHNAQATVPAARQAVPEGYARLCATFRVWDLVPWDRSIPLTCTAADQDGWPGQGYPALPLHLDQLMYIMPDEVSEPSSPSSLNQTLAMETVIEYVAATYGRDQVARLVAGLGTHESWRSMTPALFGVTLAEFEQGWQAYLAAIP